MQRYVIFSESAIKNLDSYRFSRRFAPQNDKVIGEAAGANAKRLAIKSSTKQPELMRKEAGEKDL